MNEHPAHLGYVLKRFPRISETFVAAELLELRRQGQQVTVFALSRPAEAFTHRFLTELDVPVVYLPRRPLGEPLRVARAMGRALTGRPGGWARAAAGALRPPTPRRWRRVLQSTVLAEELRRAGVDHVHAHFASTAAQLANLAWRMGGPPYSVTAHAKDIYHCSVRPSRLAETLADARFVATVSEDNVRYLKDVLCGRGRVTLVPNSVDVGRIPGPADRRPEPELVLTVARLVEKKGLDDLIRACGLLVRRAVGVRLEVLGDGPLRAELEALAAAEGVDAAFSGAVDHDEVLSAYRRASVFALPCVIASTGDRDGLPTAVLEAMAAGLPVVTTAVNGLAEAVLHGHTGMIVPQRNPHVLAAALEVLLSDPSRAAELGRQGRLHVLERFSLGASTAKLRQLFADAMVVA